MFHNWLSLENIEYEMKIARAVHASGVKSPAVFEMVQIDGRHGLIYERVQGESMLEVFRRQPWNVNRLGGLLAELHVRMHERVSDTGLPAQRSRLEYKIKNADALPDSVKSSLLGALQAQPDSDRVCHGDFHPANILLEGSDAAIIDWVDATRGNPLADVARTTIILLGAAKSSQIKNPFLKALVAMFHSTYLKHYFRLRPRGMDEYRRWLPIVAGARLNENIPELKTWLVKEAFKVGLMD